MRSSIAFEIVEQKFDWDVVCVDSAIATSISKTNYIQIYNT